MIYAPFKYFAPFGNLLISGVVDQVVWLLHLLNYPVTLNTWNIIIAQNGLGGQFILTCTGIESIAIMLGVAAAVPTTLRQKLYAFLLVAPTIYILNLFRNVFVMMAHTSQWFPFLPGIAGNGDAGNGEPGYESFFWAHNVIGEILALVVLVLIAYGLFRLIPRLGDFAHDLYHLYYDEVIREFSLMTGNAPDEPQPTPEPTGEQKKPETPQK